MPCSEGGPTQQERRDARIRQRWAAGMEGSPDIPWEAVTPYRYKPAGSREYATGYKTVAAFRSESDGQMCIPALKKRYRTIMIMRCPCD